MFQSLAHPLTSFYNCVPGKENETDASSKPLDLAKNRHIEPRTRVVVVKPESPKKSIFTSVELLARSSAGEFKTTTDDDEKHEQVTQQQNINCNVSSWNVFKQSETVNISKSYSGDCKASSTVRDMETDFNNNDLSVANFNSPDSTYVAPIHATHRSPFSTPIHHSPSLIELVKTPSLYHQQHQSQHISPQQMNINVYQQQQHLQHQQILQHQQHHFGRSQRSPNCMTTFSPQQNQTDIFNETDEQSCQGNEILL